MSKADQGPPAIGALLYHSKIDYSKELASLFQQRGSSWGLRFSDYSNLSNGGPSKGRSLGGFLIRLLQSPVFLLMFSCLSNTSSPQTPAFFFEMGLSVGWAVSV